MHYFMSYENICILSNYKKLNQPSKTSGVSLCKKIVKKVNGFLLRYGNLAQHGCPKYSEEVKHFIMRFADIVLSSHAIVNTKCPARGQ